MTDESKSLIQPAGVQFPYPAISTGGNPVLKKKG